VTTKAPSRWGSRAAALYTDAYAERYRAHDEAAREGQTVTRLGEWLRGICERFDRAIDVLDLGCGTGRYFHALVGVRRLVGIDVSRAMLDRARQPAGGSAVAPERTTLVEGDFLGHEFEPESFDLVYAIGVLAEHAPLDDAMAARVRRWLKPGGRFAFTAVDPFSPSVPRTLKRRAAEWAALAAVVPGPVRTAIRGRLTADGLYADEPRIRRVLGRAGFVIESVDPFQSDVHRHLLTVAARP
jgi:SAM-dependent methyltransferase